MMLFINKLRQSTLGAAAIETALVLPILAILGLGTFEVGRLVSRQQELQSAASEAESIILAAAASSGTSSTTIEAVIETSLGLTADQVVLSTQYRCNIAETVQNSPTGCNVDEPIYEYVRLLITDQYDPFWTDFGVGSTYNYSVDRTIQVQ